MYECLETMDCITDASECFRQMVDEMCERVGVHDEQVGWVLGERSRILREPIFHLKRRLGKSESLGDIAFSAERHNDAISHYSTALALHPVAPQDLFIKRSKANIAGGLWEAALNDANKVCPLSFAG